LIGAWKAAKWVDSFYEKNGFSVVPDEGKNRRLKIY